MHTMLKAPLFAAGIIALSSLTAITPAMAQKGFDFGLRAGAQTSALLNKQDQAAGPELDFEQKVNIPLGIGAGYTLNKHIGVGLDILFAKQGENYKGNVPASFDPATFLNAVNRLAVANNVTLMGNYTAGVALSYVKIPLMLRYTGDATKKAFFSSFIGPQISILTGAKYSINGAEAPLKNMSIVAKDAYKKTALDAVLGVGATFYLKEHITASAHLRLEYGLGDVENKKITYTYNGGTETAYYATSRSAVNNATAGLMVGLNYTLVERVKKQAKKKPGTPAHPAQKAKPGATGSAQPGIIR